MWGWLKTLFSRKVDTSPEVPEQLEPTLKDVLVQMFNEEENALREQARACDSQALRVKLHARADQVARMRLRVEELAHDA